MWWYNLLLRYFIFYRWFLSLKLILKIMITFLHNSFQVTFIIVSRGSSTPWEIPPTRYYFSFSLAHLPRYSLSLLTIFRRIYVLGHGSRPSTLARLIYPHNKIAQTLYESCDEQNLRNTMHDYKIKIKEGLQHALQFDIVHLTLAFTFLHQSSFNKCYCLIIFTIFIHKTQLSQVINFTQSNIIFYMNLLLIHYLICIHKKKKTHFILIIKNSSNDDFFNKILIYDIRFG